MSLIPRGLRKKETLAESEEKRSNAELEDVELEVLLEAHSSGLDDQQRQPVVTVAVVPAFSGRAEGQMGQ